MFKDKAIFLLVISAILIPLIFITKELILLGIFIGLFILCQVILLYLFYKQKEAGVEEWYAFWTAISSLAFMLILILFGRKVCIEFLGLLLFLAYFIGLIIFLFRKQLKPVFKTPKKKAPIKDFKSFRKKDELQKLVDAFELDTRPEVKIFDTKEPKEEPVKKPEKEIKKKRPKSRQEFKSAAFFDYSEETQRSKASGATGTGSLLEPKVRELKEAPRIPNIDFGKVKKDLEKIDTDVKTISEKIRIISEKAIKEGEKKKKQAAVKKKKPKPKKSEMKVFASKTGTKYHYDNNCLGLKRVSKKNLVTYANSKEAGKKGLKSCGMCR